MRHFLWQVIELFWQSVYNCLYMSGNTGWVVREQSLECESEPDCCSPYVTRWLSVSCLMAVAACCSLWIESEWVVVLVSQYICTFNGPFSGTARVSRYQKGKTNLDFTVARESEWQWHQLGHMQVCTSLQTGNHASTPLLSFLQAGCPFQPPNQQHQSTEGKNCHRRAGFTHSLGV